MERMGATQVYICSNYESQLKWVKRLDMPLLVSYWPPAALGAGFVLKVAAVGD